MVQGIIVISWIVYIIISISKGIIDGYIWHYWLESWFKRIIKEPKSIIKMQLEGKYIHFISNILVTGPLVLILGGLALKIPVLAILFLGISLSTINPLFHLGYIFITRNNLNPKTYIDKFKSTSLISDGNTDRFKNITNKLFNTYKKRVIFAIISILFLILTILTTI